MMKFTRLLEIAGRDRGSIVLALCLLCAPALAQQTVDLPHPAPSSTHTSVDLTLTRALELASQHNRHLQLAALALKGAEEKRTIARSDYYPHIRNESMALHVTALEGVVVPAGAFGYSPSTGLIPGQTLTIGQGGQDAFTSGTGLVEPITQLLTVHAGVKAATADLNMAKLDAEEQADSVALLVHQLYYEVLIRQLQLAAAQASLKAALIDEEETAGAVRSGQALEISQLQSHTAVLNAKQAGLTLELAINDLTDQLDDVLGLPLGTPLKLDAEALGNEPALPTKQEALNYSKQHNPKILSAEQSVQKARAGVTAAKDAYIPNISGLARYSYQSGVPFLVHNFGTFGGSVTYDLFDGGARQAKLKAAKIQLQAAQLELAQTQADISVELDTLSDEVHKLQQLVAVASEMLSVKQEALRISELRVQQNAALASEQAKARAEASLAQASLLEDRLNLRLVQNKLKQLLGQRPD